MSAPAHSFLRMNEMKKDLKAWPAVLLVMVCIAVWWYLFGAFVNLDWYWVITTHWSARICVVSMWVYTVAVIIGRSGSGGK